MRSSKGLLNLLVILLTMTSGCADAISFLALGQVLTAAMTGNTVFLGLSIVHAQGLAPLGYLVALFAFMTGNAIGAVIVRNKRQITGLNSTVTAAICAELLVFVLFGVLLALVHVVNRNILIFMLAMAMGIQGIAARRIGVNGVPTTVITSTTTGMIESLIWNFHTCLTRSSDGVSEGKRTSVPSGSIFIWAVDILIYGFGAACCGALEMKWNLDAIWLPAAIVFVVVVLAVIYQVRLRFSGSLSSSTN